MRHSKNKPRILVIKLGAVGDFFRAIPIFEWIKLQNTGARHTLLTTHSFSKLGNELAIFDDVLTIHRNDTIRLQGILYTRQFLLKFDKIFDLQFVDRTKIYRLLTIPHVRPEWHCMSTENPIISSLLLYKRTCPPINTFKNFNADSDCLHKFAIRPPFVVMVPFCSKKTAWHKRWPLPNFINVAKYLHGRGVQVVAVGNQDESNYDLLKTNDFIHNLAGKTELSDLMSIVPHATLAIGNDTGIMHLAELCKIPTVVIMSGVNDPARAAKGPNYLQFVQTPISDISAAKVIASLAHLMQDIQ